MMHNKYFEGKLTVQLINAKSGKVEQEVESTNFAANHTIRYAKWLQKSVLKSGLSGLGVADTVYAPHLPANCIVLTDSTLAENPSTEWPMQGATIGWASKSTYAGTDIWRGTVATAPIEAGSDHVKWVFDWPTHAANGTIGSVGWVYSPSQYLSATTPEFRIGMTRENVHATPNTWYRFAQATSTLSFGNIGNTVIYVLDAVYAQTTTFNIGAQFNSVRGLAWDGGNSFLWVIGDDAGSNRIIAAYDQSGVLQTGPFTLTSRNYILLAYDGSNLWSLTNTSGPNYTMWSIDPTDGSDVVNSSFTVNSTHLICGLAWDVGRSLLWTRQYDINNYIAAGIQAWDTNGNKKAVELSLGSHYTGNDGVYIDSTGSWNNKLANANANTRCDLDFVNDDVVAIPSVTSVHLCKMDGMATRSLLPAPVVKNNTQTLKVIYQINYI